MIPVVYSRRKSSGSVRIAEGLNCARVRDTPYWAAKLANRYDRSNKLLINWGNSSLPPWMQLFTNVLNKPEAVKASISKVVSYERFKAAGVPTVEFTLDGNEATRWLANGHRVLERRDGRSGGDGIRILEPGSVAVQQQDEFFFTRYYPKTHEFRVHVCSAKRLHVEPGLSVQDGRLLREREPAPELGAAAGVQEGESFENGGTTLFKDGVIDITQKKRSIQNPPGDGGGVHRTIHQRIVRSYDNGWVFAHENLHLPNGLREALDLAAVGAVKALNLDFGAVDVAVRCNPDGSFRDLKVLEVNTAPGLECTQTIQAYVEAFKRVLA